MLKTVQCYSLGFYLFTLTFTCIVFSGHSNPEAFTMQLTFGIEHPRNVLILIWAVTIISQLIMIILMSTGHYNGMLSSLLLLCL